MRVFVGLMTVLVLVVGVITGLSKLGIFVLGTALGQHRWLFYVLLAFAVLVAFALSALASLIALIAGWRDLRFRATYPLMAGLLTLVVWFFSMGHPSDAVLE